LESMKASKNPKREEGRAQAQRSPLFLSVTSVVLLKPMDEGWKRPEKGSRTAHWTRCAMKRNPRCQGQEHAVGEFRCVSEKTTLDSGALLDDGLRAEMKSVSRGWGEIVIHLDGRGLPPRLIVAASITGEAPGGKAPMQVFSQTGTYNGSVSKPFSSKVGDIGVESGESF